VGGVGIALTHARAAAQSDQLNELRKGPGVFLHGALTVRARETLSAREDEANLPTLRKSKSEVRCVRAAGASPFQGKQCQAISELTFRAAYSGSFGGRCWGSIGVTSRHRRGLLTPPRPQRSEPRRINHGDPCAPSLPAAARHRTRAARTGILRGSTRSARKLR
jgi:hypothetical protein